ncbi:30S ribosome-binding factor RbfA [Endozoicomonas arenosclerae]|uniref:30S ribosome-binding factor RbfA n=1 Tax=Endozoicomonas arenosclerae TaxID=1633495 RepID=UPI0007811AA8|nr:30S ribosome-binding factor RbfA [Endozoicomonas arenosclerae]
MAKEYSRTQRVADQIQKELAQLIQLEMKDPRLGMVTVSAVEVSRDLAFADVFVSFLGVDDQENVDEKLEVMQSAAGFLRSQLARSIKLRIIPQLRFRYDNSLRRGAYMSELISKARSGDSDHQGESEE